MAGLTRRRALQVTRRDEDLLPRIQGLKAERPLWGYRRRWAYPPVVARLAVSKGHGFRVMKEHNLLVKPNLRLKAQRTSTRSKPRPTRPHEWWGIDMTKVVVAGLGGVSIVLVVDWYTKTVVGQYAGVPGPARQWLVAVDRAVNQQSPDGVRGHDVGLRRDNGCQPTAVAFMRACQTLGSQQAFTS